MFNSPFKSACLFCLALLLVISTLATFKPMASDDQKQMFVHSDSKFDTSVSASELLKIVSDKELVKSEEQLPEQLVSYKSIDISNAKLVKNNKEIKDLNELLKIAKKEKTEFISSEKEGNTKRGILSEDKSEDEILQVNHYQASQLLEEYIDADNNEIEVYAITNFVEAIETSDLVSNSDTNEVESDFEGNDTELNLITLSTGKPELNIQNVASSKADSRWDPTLGVKAYSTIYVTKSSTSKGTFLDLSSVKGGWVIADSSYTLSNMRVRLNQTGVSTNGAVNEHIDKYPSIKTWNYTAPTSWAPVSAETSGAGTAYVGGGQYVRIKKGTSYWQFDWSNNW